MRAFIGRRESGEDALMTRLVGSGAKHGSTWFGRAGDVTKQPLAWAGAAAVLAMTGPRGRQVAARGSAGSLSATAIHLAVKVVVGRRRPPGASTHTSIGPITSSFPSGHCASALAFTLVAAQEIPLLFVPLYAATFAGEWSLVRSRAHYPSDIFAGAAISGLVGFVGWKLWPPQRRLRAETPAVASDHDRAAPTEAWAAAAPAPAALLPTVATQESGR